MVWRNQATDGVVMLMDRFGATLRNFRAKMQVGSVYKSRFIARKGSKNWEQDHLGHYRILRAVELPEVRIQARRAGVRLPRKGFWYEVFSD